MKETNPEGREHQAGGMSGKSHRPHMSREQRVYPSNQNVFQIKGDTVSHRLGPWA